MVWRVLGFALALLIAAPSAALTIVEQTRSASLRDLDLGPVATSFSFDAFVAPPGEHLIGVVAAFGAFINGRVSATNHATGGNAASRRRDATATYTLQATAIGNGLVLGDVVSTTQSKPGVPGQGNSFRLGQIDPEIIDFDVVLGGFAPFAAGPVVFDIVASQLFETVAAPDLVYDAPEITHGRTILTLIYFSAIPEPSTWLLLGSGFAVVGAGMRSRIRRTA